MSARPSKYWMQKHLEVLSTVSVALGLGAILMKPTTEDAKEKPVKFEGLTVGESLREFQAAAEMSIGNHGQLWGKLFNEELEEFLAEAAKPGASNQLTADFIKEACDLVYVLVGTVEISGLSFDEAFKRVHESNMTKAFDIAKATGGKVPKGPKYVAPDIFGLVEGKKE